MLEVMWNYPSKVANDNQLFKTKVGNFLAECINCYYFGSNDLHKSPLRIIQC